MSSETVSVVPGHSLGLITLGSSLQEVLTRIKADKSTYPKIQLHFSQATPLITPVVVNLPENGIRLQFDGADQRLRLIEVLDFKKSQLAYKGSELVKKQDGATFKRIYQLFGASYPGEYIPPKSGRAGTYVLSWPGVAFNFPLQHSTWSPNKDHVSLLGSHAASPATHMALFEGNSWPEVRNELFVRIPSGPRLSAIESAPRDMLPAEIEEAVIQGSGRLILLRRDPAHPFEMILGQTTPQDLLTELGPPDAHHKRDPQMLATQPTRARPNSLTSPSLNGRSHATPPSSYSSTGTDTFDTDFDSGDADDDPAERIERETFWCYFGHGMDILVGPPTDQTPSLPADEQAGANPRGTAATSPHLVALRVVLHGNVPGSYAFNRHRRLRWALELPGASAVLTSEYGFDELKPDLMQAFAHVWPETEMGRGKVVNRTWGGGGGGGGAGVDDSTFFLPDAEGDLVEEGEMNGSGSSEQWLGNTKLYSFPGLTFEVLANGAISALTVS